MNLECKTDSRFYTFFQFRLKNSISCLFYSKLSPRYFFKNKFVQFILITFYYLGKCGGYVKYIISYVILFIADVLTLYSKNVLSLNDCDSELWDDVANIDLL